MTTNAQRWLRSVALLSLLALTACSSDPDEQSATGEARFAAQPDTTPVALGPPSPARPEPDAAASAGPSPGHLDLDGPLSLGSRIGRGRPRLSLPCVYGEYAERPRDPYLRLTCVVSEAPLERVRVGIYGGQGRPSRLAYRIEERVLGPHEDTAAAFQAALRALSREHGPPAREASGEAPAAWWHGVGRAEGAATTLELRLRADIEVPGGWVVSRSWRHDALTRLLTE